MARDVRLSPNFMLSEFNCKDGTPVPRKYVSALRYLCREILEPLREKFGPCKVHSGFRTSAHNRAIHGARNSFHVYTIHDDDDVAADVSFRRGSVREWHREAEKLIDKKRNGKGGLGYYPQGNFIHIDTRDYEARWNGS
jgi:uncharacterized protein YcbK (DUF882 family)